jgi:hypothetical protein
MAACSLLQSNLLFGLDPNFYARSDTEFLCGVLPKINLDGDNFNKICLIINVCIRDGLAEQLSIILRFINRCKRIHNFGRFLLQKVIHMSKKYKTSLHMIKLVLDACVTLAVHWSDENRDIIENLLQICLIDDIWPVFDLVYKCLKIKNFPLHNICLACCNFGSLQIFKNQLTAFLINGITPEYCVKTIIEYSEKSIQNMEALLLSDPVDYRRRLRHFLFRQTRRKTLIAWLDFKAKEKLTLATPEEIAWYGSY